MSHGQFFFRIPMANLCVRSNNVLIAEVIIKTALFATFSITKKKQGVDNILDKIQRLILFCFNEGDCESLHED